MLNQEQQAKLCEALLAGMLGFQVPQFLAENQIELSAEEVLTELDAAWRRILTDGEIDYGKEVAKAKARMDLLFAACLQSKDFSTALGAQKELNRLFREAIPDSGKANKREPNEKIRIVK